MLWIRSFNLSSLQKNEPEHNKTIKMTCALSKDSDLPGHLPSRIRGFDSLCDVWVACFFGQTRNTLIRLGGCPGRSKTLLGAKVILFVLSWSGSKDAFQALLWYFVLTIPVSIWCSLLRSKVIWREPTCMSTSYLKSYSPPCRKMTQWKICHLLF